MLTSLTPTKILTLTKILTSTKALTLNETFKVNIYINVKKTLIPMRNENIYIEKKL